MKNPKDFNKALAFLQISDTSLYVIAAVVIYKYVGYGVHSPALTSAAPLYSIIAYAIATPTIVISGVINGHVAAVSFHSVIFYKRRVNRIYRNTSSFASLAPSQPSSLSAPSSLGVSGLAASPSFGSLHGSLRSQSQFSTIFSVSLLLSSFPGSLLAQTACSGST